MKDSYKDYLKQQRTIEKLEDQLHGLRSKSKSDLKTLVTGELEVMREYGGLAREKELEPRLLYQFFQGWRRLAGLVSGQVIVNPFNVHIQDSQNLKGTHIRNKILSKLKLNGRLLTNMEPEEAIYFINPNDSSNALHHIRGIRINLGHYVNNEKFRL